MSNPCSFSVEGFPFHAVHIISSFSQPSVLAYTFFNQAGVHTASHTRRIFTDTWDRSVLNRIDRWVMLTVNVSTLEGFSLDRPVDRSAMEKFLGALVKGLQ